MNHSLGSCIQPFGGCAPEASGARTPTRRMTRATGDERPEARRRDGRRADAFSARRMLLERILGEPDFAHYQSEGRHELVTWQKGFGLTSCRDAVVRVGEFSLFFGLLAPFRFR